FRCVSRHAARLGIIGVTGQRIALQHPQSVSAIQVRLVIWSTTVYAIEIEAWCSEVNQCIRIVLLLQAADRIESDVMVDELAEVGIARTDTEVLFVICLGFWSRRSLESSRHRRCEVVQHSCIKVRSRQGTKHSPKAALQLIRTAT